MNSLVVNRRFWVLKLLILIVLILSVIYFCLYIYKLNGFSFEPKIVATFGISFIGLFVCFGFCIDLLINYKIRILKDELRIISYSVFGKAVTYDLRYHIESVHEISEKECCFVNLKNGKNGLCLKAKSFTKRKEVENFITGLKLM